MGWWPLPLYRLSGRPAFVVRCRCCAGFGPDSAPPASWPTLATVLPLLPPPLLLLGLPLAPGASFFSCSSDSIAAGAAAAGAAAGAACTAAGRGMHG
eukprot:SAG22_NODE_4455_length_1263_cov_1.174399_2_plen_96_part_01